MATIKLRRFKKGPQYVIGELTWPEGSCYTLEHPERFQKIMGRTGIPAGLYYVRMKHSNKFGKTMPFVCDVPDFRGIMFHTGNNLSATRGCILCGESYAESGIDATLQDSRSAFRRFRNWCQSAWCTDVLLLKITDEF